MDNEILERAIKGDITAFEQIYRAYAGFVYNVSKKIVGNDEDAEDITQELFVMLHKKLKTFRGDSVLKTYIYRMAVNMSINVYNKKKKIGLKEVKLDDVEYSLGRSPVNDFADREVLDFLLSRLSVEHRACLVLREIEGLSYEEIAGALGININTVRSRLSRAREALVMEAKKLGELKR